jgi:CTP synthase (UTP-ammonia lyase)
VPEIGCTIALVGDQSPNVPAHRAIPHALRLAGEAYDGTVVWRWVDSDMIRNARRDLSVYDAIWVVPGSPYRNMNAVLAAVQFARETMCPFFGTCGGFQHAVVEFARHVANLPTAAHGEATPQADVKVVTPLACEMIDKSDEVTFTPGSRLETIFGGKPTRAEYRCRFGINPAYRPQIEAAGLKFTGFDPNGDLRALEYPKHPFFVGTLFQPERGALRGERNPLIAAFVAAAVKRAGNQ